MENYFFDTYAFFEVIKGNPGYENYSEGTALITTKMNLMELYYWLLIRKGKDEAEKYYQKFLPFCIEITDDAIKEACGFRAEHKNRDLSYVDCIGYIIAKLKNIKFLTGDKQFEDLENVKFVK